MIDPDKPQHKTKWNSDEDRILLAMHQQKQRREAIAARLGCSEEDVAARYRVLLTTMQEAEEHKKEGLNLDRVGIDPMMADLLKDRTALEALFTLLCGKYNEAGVLLKSLSQLLSEDQDAIQKRVADCIYGRLRIKAGEQEDEILKQTAEILAGDIVHNFVVHSKVQLHLHQIAPKNG